MSIKPPIDAIFVLRASQNLIKDVALQLKSQHPQTFNELNPRLALVNDALQIGITRINDLYTDLEAATKPKH